MKAKIRTLLTSLTLGALCSAPGAAFSQASIFSPQEGVNFVFGGIAGAPDYMGSDFYEAVPALMGRMYFGKSRRYVQLLGAQLSLNIIDSEDWSFGPQLLFRRGRDHDVGNDTVKQMNKVDNELEAGVFAGRTWTLNPNDRRHKFGLRADYASGEGQFGTATANYWLPVSPRIVLNFGGGLAYGNNKWTDNYFGVHGSDVALYPSLGGQPYKADGGLYDFRVNAGMVYHINKNWHLGGGFRYSQLQGDAKDSPVVSIKGTNDQWIFGVGVGYAWQ